ncbi:glycosyltransferase 87 family protein [Nocardia camponoti]|uniref:DUF2029 domain-containing protein n=1 Tax=Nocardia camponoti TaxID=1616106 RepID=A0A917QVD5_9NOCA|nr:glycosyltransferase 87 family protein [Nocardia camponoti]GGK70050.1 hypothetical protein GCM10011591_47720 [Nocardia camponoti]
MVAEPGSTTAFPRSPATFVILSLAAVTSLILLFSTMDPWLVNGGIFNGGLDAHIYRDGASRILHGRPLYDEPTLRDLLYTYTPFSAIAFTPTNLFPWQALTSTWLVLNLLTLFGCIVTSWRMLGYRITPTLLGASAIMTFGCVFLEPVRTTLYYGQINLILMLVVLLDFARPASAKLRGVGVGIAGGIKLVPLFFIVEFAALRQWRAAVVASATFAGTVVGTALLLPVESREYWTSIFFQSGRIAPDDHPANQSLRGLIAHLGGGPAPLWLWALGVGVAVAVGLTVSVALHRTGERLLSITVAGLTACVVSPFSWGHHWVWFVPLLVYIVHRATQSARYWLVALGLSLAIAAWTYTYLPGWVSVGTFLLPPWWFGAPLMQNVYVALYVLVIAACARLVYTNRQGAQALPPSEVEVEIPTPLVAQR